MAISKSVNFIGPYRKEGRKCTLGLGVVAYTYSPATEKAEIGRITV